MKLYKVWAPDGRDWDEYEGFVIAANSEAEARKIAADQSAKAALNIEHDRRFWEQEASVEYLGEAAEGGLREPHIILEDFLRG